MLHVQRLGNLEFQNIVANARLGYSFVLSRRKRCKWLTGVMRQFICYGDYSLM